MIRRDARVLRQIKYLASHYRLSIIGYGDPPDKYDNLIGIQWRFVMPPESLESSNLLMKRNIFLKNIGKVVQFLLSKMRKLINSILLGAGHLSPVFYEIWYWKKKHYHSAFEYITQSRCDAILANDWESLPVAVKAAKQLSAKLVFDAHEYAPLQFENKLIWRLFFKKAIIYFLNKYSKQIDASFTVCAPISERYHQEFGLEPIVILNAPEKVEIQEREVEFAHVRLIHHGAAIRARKLEIMIKALGLSNGRFSLHFKLIEIDHKYFDELKKIAEYTAPGRVVFDPPVHPDEIAHNIFQYDIGFCLIYPSNFNYKISLPNKLFDYIIAGLPVLVGPSPEMVKLVQEHKVGWVAPSFEPEDIAYTLNRITLDELIEKRLATREAAKKMNASTEMSKMCNIFNQLLSQNK